MREKYDFSNAIARGEKEISFDRSHLDSRIVPITIDDMDAPFHLKRNCITDNAQPPPRFNVCFPASGMIARRDIREPSARNEGIYDANCSMKIYCDSSIASRRSEASPPWRVLSPSLVSLCPFSSTSTVAF